MSRRSVLIESLAATPNDLARMLRPVNGPTALRRPTPESWCIADVVAHLGEMEVRYLAVLRQIVAEDNPSIPWLSPRPEVHDLAQPLGVLLEQFTANRQETIAFLSGLEQRDWARTLVHATLGPMRLRDRVQALVAHDNEHLDQIIGLREHTP